MAIYCMQCGKELPDDAQFCLQCGKPLKAAVTVTPQVTSHWEYCEIVCIRRGFFGGKSYFVAQAAGNKGRYEAARSTKPFYATSPTTSIGEEVGKPDADSQNSEKKTKEALDEIMSTLSTDGWELTGQKGEWWEYKYRRLVKI